MGGCTYYIAMRCAAPTTKGGWPLYIYIPPYIYRGPPYRKNRGGGGAGMTFKTIPGRSRTKNLNSAKTFFLHSDGQFESLASAGGKPPSF